MVVGIASVLARANTRDDLLFRRDVGTHADHRLQISDSRFKHDLCCIVLTTIQHDARSKEKLRGMDEINISWPCEYHSGLLSPHDKRQLASSACGMSRWHLLDCRSESRAGNQTIQSSYFFIVARNTRIKEILFNTKRSVIAMLRSMSIL